MTKLNIFKKALPKWHKSCSVCENKDWCIGIEYSENLYYTICKKCFVGGNE